MAEAANNRPRPRGIRGKYVVLIIVLAAATTVVWSVKVGRHYFLPKRFFEVEAGQLYRSGYIEPNPLRQVLTEHKIKTILCLLNDEPDNPDQKKEEAVADETRVRLMRIPMPGDGVADPDSLDRAADVIEDPANRPVLVHCAGGENRTGAAYAAYRMKYCGWSFDKAIAEGDRFGLPLHKKPELVGRLRAYHEHLAASSQPATIAPSQQ